MLKQLYKFTSIVFVLIVLFSCGNKINQNSMFQDRNHVSKKRGVHDAGMNRHEAYKTPPSEQTKKEYDKLSKYDTNPKKAAKKQAKEIKKKKLTAAKARNKYNRKRHVKVKTTKEKTNGGT